MVVKMHTTLRFILSSACCLLMTETSLAFCSAWEFKRRTPHSGTWVRIHFVHSLDDAGLHFSATCYLQGCEGSDERQKRICVSVGHALNFCHSALRAQGGGKHPCEAYSGKIAQEEHNGPLFLILLPVCQTTSHKKCYNCGFWLLLPTSYTHLASIPSCLLLTITQLSGWNRCSIECTGCYFLL